MNECHDNKLAGHVGKDKTIELVSRNFYWPKMHDEIMKYVSTCLLCQSNKPSNQSPSGLLQPLPIPSRPWQIISMDFITQLPKTNKGNDAITVIVCKLSKMVHFIPCKTTITAPQTANIVFEYVVRHHGIPSIIISDRDARFTSMFWKSLWKLLGTKLNMSTAYHPQTDGQTERTNRTLEEMLRAYVNYQQSDWDDYLISAEIAFNNSFQLSTGYSPYYLNHGFHPSFPIQMTSESEQESKNEASNQFLTNMQESIEKANAGGG